MAKSRNVQIALAETVRDDIDAVSVRFYIMDGTPRVAVFLAQDNGTAIPVDRPLSDFTTLNAGQKVTLRNLLTSIRDQALTLEGFA